jgi:hypothetical protein
VRDHRWERRLRRGVDAPSIDESRILRAGSHRRSRFPVKQARRESCRNGMTVCRLMLEIPELRQTIDSYAEIAAILTGGASLYRMWRARLIWVAPRVFRWVADILTKVAAQGPPRCVPVWTRYPPLAIAFWDGMQKVAPSYGALRTALLDRSNGE